MNFYFTLAAGCEFPSRDSPEILRAAETIEPVQSRFAKPVLFVEGGFPVLATAAERPWEESSSALDTGSQTLCNAVWMERFARERNMAGRFWWNWRGHGRGSSFDPSHRPFAKPAMAVPANWFDRLRDPEACRKGRLQVAMHRARASGRSLEGHPQQGGLRSARCPTRAGTRLGSANRRARPVPCRSARYCRFRSSAPCRGWTQARPVDSSAVVSNRGRGLLSA